jgi:hypothetical protein
MLQKNWFFLFMKVSHEMDIGYVTIVEEFGVTQPTTLYMKMESKGPESEGPESEGPESEGPESEEPECEEPECEDLETNCGQT